MLHNVLLVSAVQQCESALSIHISPSSRASLPHTPIPPVQVITEYQAVLPVLYKSFPLVVSHVRLFAAQWTVAHQAPPSMGFSRQEYWSGLPCPPPGHHPGPGIEPVTLMSPVLASWFFTTSATCEAPYLLIQHFIFTFIFLDKSLHNGLDRNFLFLMSGAHQSIQYDTQPMGKTCLSFYIRMIAPQLQKVYAPN